MDFRFDFSLTVDKLVQPAGQGSRAVGLLTSKLEAASKAIEKLDPLADKLSHKLAGLRDAFGRVGAADSGLQKIVRGLEHVGKAATNARSRNETNMAKIADDWQKMGEKAERAEQRKTRALEREAAQRLRISEKEAAAAERLAEKQRKAAEKAARNPIFGGYRSIGELFREEGKSYVQGKVRGAAQGIIGIPGMAMGALGGGLGLAASAVGSGISAGFDLAGEAAGAAVSFAKMAISAQAMREQSVEGFKAIYGSAAVGDKLFDQSVRIAKLTKFDTDQVVATFNTLAANKFKENELTTLFAGYADVASARGSLKASQHLRGMSSLNASPAAYYGAFKQAAAGGAGEGSALEALADILGLKKDAGLKKKVMSMMRGGQISSSDAIRANLNAIQGLYDKNESGGLNVLGSFARKQGEGTWEGLISNIKNGLADVLTMKLPENHPMLKFKGILKEINGLFDEQSVRGKQFQRLMSNLVEDVFLVFDIDPDKTGKAMDNLLGLATRLEYKLHDVALWMRDNITRPLVDGLGTDSFLDKMKDMVVDLGKLIGQGIYEGVKAAALGSAKGIVVGLGDAVADTPRAAKSLASRTGDFLMGDSLITGARDFISATASDLGSGLADAVPKMAEGGIVRKPTLAVIGEAGPEAVVPLGRGGGMGGGIHIDQVILQLPEGASGMGGREYGEEAAIALLRFLGQQVRNPTAGTVRG